MAPQRQLRGNNKPLAVRDKATESCRDSCNSVEDDESNRDFGVQLPLWDRLHVLNDFPKTKNNNKIQVAFQ
jgi:hypothetical protein